jgi:hypothetical protein
MQSCISRRNAFFTGMYPLRTDMIPPQLPGSPSYCTFIERVYSLKTSASNDPF